MVRLRESPILSYLPSLSAGGGHRPIHQAERAADPEVYDQPADRGGERLQNNDDLFDIAGTEEIDLKKTPEDTWPAF